MTLLEINTQPQTDPHEKGYQIAKEKLKGYLHDDNFPYDDIYDIIADAYAEGFIDASEKKEP